MLTISLTPRAGIVRRRGGRQQSYLRDADPEEDKQSYVQQEDGVSERV